MRFRNAIIATLQYARGRKAALVLFVVVNALAASVLVSVSGFGAEVRSRLNPELDVNGPVFTLGETTRGPRFQPLSLRDLAVLRRIPDVDRVVAFAGRKERITLPDGSESEQRVAHVSRDGLRAAGGHLVQGRYFNDGHDRWREVVISRHFWHTELSGKDPVLGSALEIRGERFRVVGILDEAPAWFPGLVERGRRGENHVWVPVGALQATTLPPRLPDPLARRMPIVNAAIAGNALNTADAAAALAADWLNRDDRGGPARRFEAVRGLNIHPRAAERSSQVAGALGAVGLTLFLAVAVASCVFLGNQARDRRNEFALYRTLGADTGALASIALTQALLLSGAVLSLAALLSVPNQWFLGLLSPLPGSGAGMSLSGSWLAWGHLAAGALVFALAAACYRPMIAGVRPRHLFPVHFVIGDSRVRTFMAWAFLALQVCVATVAVALGVNLSLRATEALGAGWGVPAQDVRVLRPQPSVSGEGWTRISIPDRRTWANLTRRLAEDPAIHSVAVANAAPGDSPAMVERLKPAGAPEAGGASVPVVINTVSGDFFDALGLEPRGARSARALSAGAVVTRSFLEAFGFSDFRDVPDLAELDAPEMLRGRPIVATVDDLRFASPFESPRPTIHVPMGPHLMAPKLVVRGGVGADELVDKVNAFFRDHDVRFEVDDAPALTSLKWRFVAPHLALTGFTLFVTLACACVMFLSCWSEVGRVTRVNRRTFALYRALGATGRAVKRRAGRTLLGAGTTGVSVGGLLFAWLVAAGAAQRFLPRVESLFTWPGSLLGLVPAAALVATLLLVAWRPLALAIAREPGRHLAEE